MSVIIRILAIDIGNSNIKIGVYEDARCLHQWRIATTPNRTADEIGILVRAMFLDVGFSADLLSGAIVSSVVPSVLPTIVQTCERYLNQTPLVVGPGLKTGLPILGDNPREVGSDRIANAVAGLSRFGPPLIIVDFGTATTFGIVDAEGRYVGGIIAPGLQTSAEALFERAEKLPHIEFLKPRQVIGKNTVASMQSGVYYGFAGLVDGLVARIRGELSLPFRVIATGGWADFVSPETTSIQEVCPLLTLDGLRLLWLRNRMDSHVVDEKRSR